MKSIITLAIFFSIHASATEEATSRLKPAAPAARGWATAGLGTANIALNQTIDTKAVFETESTASGISQRLEAGYIGTSNWGGQISYTYIPGQMVFTNTSNRNFAWSELTGDLIAHMPGTAMAFGSPIVFGARAGLARRETTLMLIDSQANIVSKDVALTWATAGASMELTSGRWHHLIHLGSEVPVESNNYRFDNDFILTGGLGSTLLLAGRYTMGLFAATKAIRGTYRYKDDQLSASGRQQLIATNLDFRLGMNF